MSASRLSALDASFLAVESPTAPMHVGWIATFRPPPGRPPPSFEQLRDHIAARLPRAPRYRQRLVTPPLGLTSPVWTDDPDFELDHHVERSGRTALSEAVADAMSSQLDPRRPLWQLTVADRLEDGLIGVIGKAHHCMVDGIAAVEMASLLVDPEPNPARPRPQRWHPARASGGARLLAEGVWTGLSRRARLPLRAPAALRAAAGNLGDAEGLALAARDLLRPAPDAGPLSRPLTPRRHLGMVRRPLAELRSIGRAHVGTLNDVMLAATAGALRRYLSVRGLPSIPLKAMVPVNVRAEGQPSGPGNQISFMFVDLPCDEPDPVRRLHRIHLATSKRKSTGVPGATKLLLDVASELPYPAQRAVARLISRPEAFSLSVSNIPGPADPLYMCGCELEAAYPVVPLAERHAVSVGMTSIREHACFGLYADRRLVPNVGELAADLDTSIEELLATLRRGRERVPEGPLAPSPAESVEAIRPWRTEAGVPIG